MPKWYKNSSSLNCNVIMKLSTSGSRDIKNIPLLISLGTKKYSYQTLLATLVVAWYKYFLALVRLVVEYFLYHSTRRLIILQYSNTIPKECFHVLLLLWILNTLLYMLCTQLNKSFSFCQVLILYTCKVNVTKVEKVLRKTCCQNCHKVPFQDCFHGWTTKGHELHWFWTSMKWTQKW